MTVAELLRQGLSPAGRTGAPPAAADSRWLRRYSQLLVAVDAAALLLAGFTALALSVGTPTRGLSGYALVGALSLTWFLPLAAGRCYERRFVGTGGEEFRRVGNASVRFIAGVAVVAYGAQLQLPRHVLAYYVPLGVLLLLVGRWLARIWLHRARSQGRCCHRVVVVGSPAQARDLVRQLERARPAGLKVVGACVPPEHTLATLGSGVDVPVVGSLHTVRAALVDVQADTVAVAASPALSGDALRRLSYELEGTHVDLLVSPGLTNATGTRISIRPVAGLPLLHVDEPELTGGRKLLKAAFDRSVALLMLVAASPLLAVLAVAVRLTSSGPAFFRQQRVGREGVLFDVWKLRSMYDDAEHRRRHLEQHNERDGVLFKIRQDPRVTPIGRWLRKTSLDELPQLVNVVLGHMSLVGPRPPLPSEVDRYDGYAHRRLLVKPGITGLGQVSGRSDLSWEETVRLDLQYVEDWSLGLDLVVLAKTVLAVVRGRGAY